METADVLPNPTTISVDVVDDLLFVGDALRSTASDQPPHLLIRRVESNWIPYIANFDEASRVVVFRAELVDHVPTLLKVRALSRIDACPIVLANHPTEQHVERLYEAGARAVLTADHTFKHVLDAVKQCVFENERHPTSTAAPVTTPTRRLSDRELQAAALFTGRTAPSARIIAELLGLPLASVRTHLQRARMVLREVGETSTRAMLRDALIADGWIDAVAE